MTHFFNTRATPVQIIILSFFALGSSACSEPEVTAERPMRPVVWAEAAAWEGTESSRYVGRIEYAEAPILAFEVSGTITRMDVDRGDRFSRGDVLARLNDRTYALDVDRRNAAIRQAKAQLVNAELDYNRKAALTGTGAIAQSAIDAAEATRDSARSTLAELEASKSQALKSRADTVLRAPFSGQVIGRKVEPGATVAGGAPILEVSAQNAPLQATFFLSEQDIDKLNVDDSLDIVLPVLDMQINGIVAEIGTTALTSLAFPVSLNLPDESRLRAGMTAVLSLGQTIQSEDNLVLLPSPAVMTGTQNSYVALLNGDTVRFQNVDVQKVTDEGLVVSGVSPGARIITRGTAQLRDGQTVIPLEASMRRYPE